MTDANVQPYNPGLGVAFKVVSVTETTGQDATGRFVPGKQITYQIKSGASGTIFVTDANFNEDMVRAALQVAAAKLYNISTLSQGM